MDEKETFSTVKDIFSAGKWNGDVYTVADLDDMVVNFEKLKAENRRVPLKANMFKKEAVNDGKYHGGMPAIGWVDKLERVGEKLYATITDIPRVVKELIEKKAYRQVSAELMWNMRHNGERLNKVLTGIGLLGVEMPGVGNLDDFATMYESISTGESKMHTYEDNCPTGQSKQEDNSMELKEMQEKLAQSEQELAQAKEYAAKIEAEKKVLEEKAAADAQCAAELAAGQRAEKIKVFVAELVKDGKVLPKHTATISAVIESMDDSKTVMFTVDGKEEQKGVRSMFESMLSELPKIVDFTEKSASEGKAEFVAEENGAFSVESQELDFKAKEYMKKNEGVTYKEALIAVSKKEEN